ncbi:MAG: hypothetical protein ACHQC8_02280 [Solirubrobacterales bacterium]
MPTLDCPVRHRILDAPVEYGPLADFSCGKGGEREEREVNRTIAQLFNGKAPVQMLVVVLEKTEGADAFGRAPLIGVSGVYSMQAAGLPGLDEGGAFVAFVPAIGIDEKYQGKRLEDGETRCGSALLISTMVVAKAMMGGGPTPAALAKVDPENDRSQNLFKRHGFEKVGREAEFDMMLRPPDLDPDFRREPNG